jgi:hypothetical protein
MAAMAMRLTPKVRISPPVIGGEWRAVWCDLHQKPANSVPNDRSLPDTVRGATLVWHNPPFLLAVCTYNARDTCSLTPPAFVRLPATARNPAGRLSIVGDRAPGNVLAQSGRAVPVTGGERWSARLAGRGSGAHIGPPNGGDTR